MTENLNEFPCSPSKIIVYKRIVSGFVIQSDKIVPGGNFPSALAHDSIQYPMAWMLTRKGGLNMEAGLSE